MLATGQTAAQKLHSSLGHPIVDADGHWLECTPVSTLDRAALLQFAEKYGREAAVADFLAGTVVATAAADVLARAR